RAISKNAVDADASVTDSANSAVNVQINAHPRLPFRIENAKTRKSEIAEVPDGVGVSFGRSWSARIARFCSTTLLSPSRFRSFRAHCFSPRNRQLASGATDADLSAQGAPAGGGGFDGRVADRRRARRRGHRLQFGGGRVGDDPLAHRLAHPQDLEHPRAALV